MSKEGYISKKKTKEGRMKGVKENEAGERKEK